VLTAVEEFAFLTVIERIVKALERLALEHGVPHRLGTRIGLKLTHLDIATLVGSTRETVTIQVNKLQHEGRLVIEGRNFILPQTTAPA
jgi:CRP/FNR family transcriptional regulator